MGATNARDGMGTTEAKEGGIAGGGPAFLARRDVPNRLADRARALPAAKRRMGLSTERLSGDVLRGA